MSNAHDRKPSKRVPDFLVPQSAQELWDQKRHTDQKEMEGDEKEVARSKTSLDLAKGHWTVNQSPAN